MHILLGKYRCKWKKTVKEAFLGPRFPCLVSYRPSVVLGPRPGFRTFQMHSLAGLCTGSEQWEGFPRLAFPSTHFILYRESVDVRVMCRRVWIGVCCCLTQNYCSVMTGWLICWEQKYTTFIRWKNFSVFIVQGQSLIVMDSEKNLIW